VVRHRWRSMRKRDSAPRVYRSVRRRWSVERLEKPAEISRDGQGVERGSGTAFALKPRHDAPRPRKAVARLSNSRGRRNRQRQPRREERKPLLFSKNEYGGRCSTRQTHSERVAQPVDLVVPAGVAVGERKVRQVRMLFEEAPRTSGASTTASAGGVGWIVMRYTLRDSVWLARD
jgi:hypothetical protein